MTKKILLAKRAILISFILVIICAICSKQEGIKLENSENNGMAEVQNWQMVESSDSVSEKLLSSKTERSNTLVARVKSSITNKRPSKKEAYVNWKWDGVRKKRGVMKGIRTWLNSNGKEKTKKLTVKSSYIVGQGKWGDVNKGDMVPVSKMCETSKGNLYFLCNVNESKQWKINYLVTSSSGKELRGGKLNLKSLMKKEDGSYNKYLWFTDIEIVGNKIIVGYQNSSQYASMTSDSRCGILFINTKTGKWTNMELDAEMWRGMMLSCDVIYRMVDDKAVSIMKYNIGEEMEISLPNIEIPQPAYTGESVEVGRITYLDDKIYLLDVHGNIYVCDLSGNGTFEMFYTDEIHSYPDYTLHNLQISESGKNLYAAFWMGSDDCYPDDYKPYYWVKYDISK